jgi:hypothetical protein
MTQILRKNKNIIYNFMSPESKIDLIKWFLGSFVLVIVTTIISYQFQDREHGLNEMNQYDKYVTELIVLNKDLGKRRLLAQYFAYVTPSEKLREPWMNYYQLLDAEYKLTQKQDSLLSLEIKTLEEEDSTYKSHLLEKREILKQKLSDELQIPQVKDNKLEEAERLERLGFESALNGNNKEAISYFEQCERVYPSFHSSYEIVRYLKENKDSDKKTICKGLLKYTWKVPKDIVDRLKLDS